eukprot:scaffold240981_cov17-Tisochrysis_lutea.AAC.1
MTFQWKSYPYACGHQHACTHGLYTCSPAAVLRPGRGTAPAPPPAARCASAHAQCRDSAGRKLPV